MGVDTITLKGYINLKTLIMAIASVFAVAGAYLNALGNILCFPVWLITNSIFAIVARKDKNPSMAFIFALYFSTSVLGLWVW